MFKVLLNILQCVLDFKNSQKSNVNDVQEILENVKLIVQTVTISTSTDSCSGRKFPNKTHTSPRFLERDLIKNTFLTIIRALMYMHERYKPFPGYAHYLERRNHRTY